MIKGVFFDLYNTIAHFYPPKEELQKAACLDFGIQVNPEGILRGYVTADEFMARENARLPIARRLSKEQQEFFGEYERLILTGAGVDVDRNLAGRIFTRLRQMPYDLALYDDVLPAMDMLKMQEITLGLISNLRGDIAELCQRLRLTPYLDFVVTSEEVGAEKPHPPIFLAALRKAEVGPGEAIHVGDQYQSDVLGARAVGIKPLLIDRDGLLGEISDCAKITSLMEVVEHLG